MLVLCLAGNLAGEEAAAPQPGYDGAPIDPARPVAVRIVTPQPDAVIPDNALDVFLQADNYTLAPGGNRLHVILDNQPPATVEDSRLPLSLKNLSEGGHTLRVLAVKPDGTALSDPEAYALVHFFVRRRDFQNLAGPGPYLTVNLPAEGPVTGAVWVDFRVDRLPAPLGKDSYVVRCRVNQSEKILTEAKAFAWEKLPPGKYTVTMELLTGTLDPAPGLFNQVVRSFTVEVPVKALPVAPEAPRGRVTPQD